MTDAERIHQMQILWKKARNMYSSFFVLLGEKHREVGDAGLAGWCFDDLHIGLEACLEVSRCLKDSDAKRVRQELARAQAVERAEKQAAVEAERVRIAAAKAEAAAEKAEREAEAKRRQGLAAAALHSASGNLVTQALVDDIKQLLIGGDAVYGLPRLSLMEKHGVKEAVYKSAVREARGELRKEAEYTGAIPKPKQPAPRQPKPSKVKPEPEKAGGAKLVARPALSLNADLARLLAECEEIEKPTRPELGKRYFLMKQIIERREAGDNPKTGKPWSWVKWSAAHIGRSRVDIYKCITEFVASCNNSVINPGAPAAALRVYH